MKARFIHIYIIFAAICLAITGPVQAQTEQAAVGQEAGGALEEIVVTGSRLRRDSFNVTTPLVTMDTQAIQDTGLGSLAEVLI